MIWRRGRATPKNKFTFRIPENGGRIAGRSHNLTTTLSDFLDGGGESSWIFNPGHEVSARMLGHPFIENIYNAYSSGGMWLHTGESYAEWNFDLQYTTFFTDFTNDVGDVLGFWGEGMRHRDFGTNLLGSFNVRGQIIFDRVNNMRSINLDIYNRFTGASMLRNPITRAPGPGLGLSPVHTYIRISEKESLR
jgi:hypothetical protein